MISIVVLRHPPPLEHWLVVVLPRVATSKVVQLEVTAFVRFFLKATYHKSSNTGISSKRKEKEIIPWGFVTHQRAFQEFALYTRILILFGIMSFALPLIRVGRKFVLLGN